MREKPGMAGACGKSVGQSFGCDKPAGMFVVSSKMLVGLVEYRESGRTRESRTDVRKDGQTGKINKKYVNSYAVLHACLTTIETCGSSDLPVRF